jgi:tetratricopeptide (TPR) repeat protein
MEARVTHGTIALRNLEAQIAGLEPERAPCRARVDEPVWLIDLLALRGSILGSIADYERALELGEQLAGDAATEAAAFVARARTRALFHRFADALDDLELAEHLAIDPETASRERAAVFQGLGRFDEATAIREEDARRRPNFESLGALTTLCAERGDTERAERLHAETVGQYRGVSPLPLALLEFQIGVMWMHSEQLDRARDHLSAARFYVPAYVPARGHLAEVEAELGNVESAIALVSPLATTSDDPDYAGQLAHILADPRSSEESQYWRKHAAKRYDELIAVHPEAFADHAAEFWLGAGNDPRKALRLARMNVAIRKTVRARALLSRAVVACEAASALGSLEPALSQSTTRSPDQSSLQ